MSTLLPCNYFTHSAPAGGHRGQPLETPLGAVGGPEGGPAASNREPGPPPYPVRMAWLGGLSYGPAWTRTRDLPIMSAILPLHGFACARGSPVFKPFYGLSPARALPVFLWPMWPSVWPTSRRRGSPHRR